MDEKVAAWHELVVKYQGTPYEYLARVEEGKVDRAKVTFVELNRHRIKDGNEMVVVGYTQLVTKHGQSKNVYQFLLDFGDFYALLAREYLAQYDPEGLRRIVNMNDIRRRPASPGPPQLDVICHTRTPSRPRSRWHSAHFRLLASRPSRPD